MARDHRGNILVANRPSIAEGHIINKADIIDKMSALVIANTGLQAKDLQELRPYEAPPEREFARYIEN